MSFLYNIIIQFYYWFIQLAALFNTKAKLWVDGRKGIFSRLANDFNDNSRVVWFHAASLGEFEQGRPVMEAYREKFPGTRILLTFFSPSGYEIRKNYRGADYIYYLPIDTPRNVKRFIDIVNPDGVIFIKYEFWFNYLDYLNKKNIPVYVISAIFRPEQHFFKGYGRWARKQLKKITTFFVQDERSKQLLVSAGINNVLISGDTRFDRVSRIASQKKDFPLIEKFSKGKQVLLAGSSWPPDEKLLFALFNGTIKNLGLIIAPHEIDEERIKSIFSLFGDQNPVPYSQLNEQNIASTNVLVIDGIGFLSSLYQYCDVAMIGGGFGKGIHNILEAATFGKPVVFGPNFDKFAEAKSLVGQKGAFVVNENNFEDIVFQLFNDSGMYKNASDAGKSYIEQNRGATQLILKHLN